MDKIQELVERNIRQWMLQEKINPLVQKDFLIPTEVYSNALLVKPKLSEWNKFRIHLASQYELLDLTHQIYVPEHFVLGHFKDRKDGFILRPGGIFYKDSTEILQQYQEDIDNGKLEVVKSLLLPDSILESIAKQSEIYLDARKQIANQIRLIDI